MPRIGVGYDIHRLAVDRTLVLGGVIIPSPQGLSGHSDADVLVHAIMDALLGAAGLPDIGHHFPPGDPQYRDADSLWLLRQVHGLLEQHQWQVGNVDSTVIAEAPRLAPYLAAMRANIARTLGIPEDAVSIKAKTAEGLDAVGAGRGIAAHAVALLIRAPALQDCACTTPR